VATDQVTLALARGEVHALIGPNGAGKTTLIAQIDGSLAPDAGRIVFDGADITSMSRHQRVRAGLARSYVVRAAAHPASTNYVIVLVRRLADVGAAYSPEDSL